MGQISRDSELATLVPLPASPRPPWIHIVIVGLAAVTLGLTLAAPTPQQANDRSRWCTVWSLVEKGRYSIDECPWSTIDKVLRDDPHAERAPGQPVPRHFYSSKPALLPTLVAGMILPLRLATHVPMSPVGHDLSRPRFIQALYFKGPLVLLNVVPFVLFFALFTRRAAATGSPEDTAIALSAGALGTPLLAFNGTLNNHTVAAYSAFFALHAFLRITEEEDPRPRHFVVAGFFGAFCATNELPAIIFPLVPPRDVGPTLASPDHVVFRSAGRDSVRRADCHPVRSLRPGAAHVPAVRQGRLSLPR